MSVSFQVIGIYKNGKKRTAGVHFPKGLRTSQQEVMAEISKFGVRFEEEIIGNFNKFHSWKYVSHLNGAWLNEYEDRVELTKRANIEFETIQKQIERCRGYVREEILLAVTGRCAKDAPVGMNINDYESRAMAKRIKR
jgi:hypothetical protein